MFTKKNKAKVQYFIKPKKKRPTNTYNCLYSVLFCFRPSSKKSQTIAVLSPKQNVGFSPFPLSKLVESGGRVKKKQIGASEVFFFHPYDFTFLLRDGNMSARLCC